MANEIIEASVISENIGLSDDVAGTVGSYNAKSLALSFDSAWDNTTKKVYFYDANGGNERFVLLTTSLLIDGVYIVPIPAEPLGYAGDMTLTIKGVDFATDGTTVERIIMAASKKMIVLPSIIPSTDTAPVEPTPTQAEQLQAEIDDIKATILNAEQAAEDAEAAQAAAESARDSAITAENAALAAQAAAELAETNAETAEANAETAEGGAVTAKNDAITAKDAAVVAKTAAEAAQGAAETAQLAAVAAKNAAQTAQTAAESAQTGAISAKDAAVTAKNAAVAAQGLAETAKTAAQGAQAAAETAQGLSEDARDAAQGYASDAHTDALAAASAKDDSIAAKNAAQTAQGLAETAKAGADAAKLGADTAKAGADTAKSAAESARDTAVTAKNSAESAKTEAETAKTAAELAESHAETAEVNAETAESNAEGHAEDAEAWADGTINGIAVTSEHPAYHNNSKYYKDLAAEIVGGDYPTKSEAQGYVNTHAESETAHSTLFGGKVDKVTGKGLSANDLTDLLKTAYDGAVSDKHSHGNKTALDNVSGTNTGDQDLSGKVDKVTGKGLSTEDYTTAEKTKLGEISGTNTGDETEATIKSKLGISTLLGSNTGDQDLSGKQDTTNGLTAETAIADGDYFPFYDISETAHRKTLWSNVISVLGSAFAALSHKSRHASGGADALSPSDIGAAPATHSHAASDVNAGTLAGQVVANAAAVATIGTAQVRNIYAGTADLTAGVSALATGDLYFMYE